MERSNNNDKVIGALLLGAAVGGLLGVLFAPDKGSETRKKIMEQSGGLADILKQKFNEFIQEATAEASMMKEEVDEVLSDGVAKS